MPTVLNVLYYSEVGGPTLRVLQVARQLRAQGIETVVVIPRGDRAFTRLLQEAEVPFHEMDLVRLRDTWNPAVHARFVRRFWPNVAELRRLIRRHSTRNRTPIVHTNGLLHLQAAIAARLEGVPLVWHLNDSCAPRWARRAILPLVARWADGIAVSARAVARFYFPGCHAEGSEACAVARNRHGKSRFFAALKMTGREARGTLGERTHLLYAPVDTEKFHPGGDGDEQIGYTRIREELDIPESAPLVGIVTNLCPGKGVQYLLEAAARILERFPAARFLVVGAELRNRRAYARLLERRVQELGLGGRAIFTGARRDIPQVCRALTVYVQTSESEACPMAVMEASASGVPVVATGVGGTRELVEDGVTGLVIPPRSPGAIAAAVLRLLDAPAMARRLGAAGAERMRRLFSLDACVREHARMYAASGTAAVRSRKSVSSESLSADFGVRADTSVS